MYKYDSPQDCNHSNYPEIKAGTVCCSDSDKKIPASALSEALWKNPLLQCQKMPYPILSGLHNASTSIFPD